MATFDSLMLQLRMRARGPRGDRVRGYWYGYHGLHGPGRDFLSNREYIRGWKEGNELREDERRAFKARLNRN